MGGVVKSIWMVVAVAVVIPAVAAAMGCGTVVSYLNPCVPYVTDRGALEAGCCNGVVALYAAANTTSERQDVCSCLKSLAASFTAVDFTKAAELPARCGLNMPYKITPSTDCATIK